MMQKSRVQEMFPIDENKLWRRKFQGGCALLGFTLGLALAFTILMIALKPFSSMVLAAVILAWLVGTIIPIALAYFFANRAVKNYYFDVTDEGIILGKKTILFKDILDIYVFQNYWGGYGVGSTARYVYRSWGERLGFRSTAKEGAIVMIPHPDLGPFRTGDYFDEKTAFALKEYIVGKMKTGRV
jgi:hypothetical protein